MIQDVFFEIVSTEVPDANTAYHIVIESGSELWDVSVHRCTLTGGKYGVIIDGPTGFGIIDNWFESVTLPIRAGSAGEAFNEIRCNQIHAQNLVGITASKENSNLLIRYNDFLTNAIFFEVNVNGAEDDPGMIPTQGFVNDPARIVSLITNR